MNLTKDRILTVARASRSFKEMSEKTGADHTRIRILTQKFHVYRQVREMFLENRKINPVLCDKYSVGDIVDLAQRCRTLEEMGNHLSLSRERIRQIVNKFGIYNFVRSTLRNNKLSRGRKDDDV